MEISKILNTGFKVGERMVRITFTDSEEGKVRKGIKKGFSRELELPDGW